MITETVTKNGTPAITSDHWHVVHAHFAGDDNCTLPYARAIVSEHDDRNDCREAARALTASLDAEAKKVPASKRDQVFARPPNYKSLKSARRHKPE